MPAIVMNFNEPAWPDLAVKENLHHVTSDMQITGVPGGMASGKPSVMLRIELADGSTVIAETSLVLLLTVADGLKAKYGDPRS